MANISLSSADIKGLNTFSNDRDVLRDLFIYLDYVRGRSIKRTTRTNEIPHADLQRMAKTLGGLSFNPGVEEIDASQWIEFIDLLAYNLQLVHYDTEGKYRGFSSVEPSFIDNYILVNEEALLKFFEIGPVDQEKRIVEALKAPKLLSAFRIVASNEFYNTSVLGTLDTFGIWGSATGVIPTLNFPEIRQFLLNLLAQCTPGVWYSTESLVQYLKTNHPFFLIPKEIPADRWGKTSGRYSNFYEMENIQSYEKEMVPEDAPDAFERVEGRYVERFLENIPLIMRFVDVAYDPEPYKGKRPTRDRLKAFRVNERLQRLISGVKSVPHVTIQPNFEVVVEADIYPAKIIQQVALLGEQIPTPPNSSAFVGIYRLNKACVAAEQIRQPSLDVAELLKKLSGRDLPANVQIELEEWSGHADQFILYEGFALLESVDEIPQVERFKVERISPNLNLVQDQEAFYRILEDDSCVPMRVEHSPENFHPLPEAVISVFPKKCLKEDVEAIPHIKVKHIISVTVTFPDRASFDAFSKMLAEMRCPFQSDLKMHSITFDQKDQAKFDMAVQKLADAFTIEIE